MKTNIRAAGAALETHEGAPARAISALAALRRSVASCMLWEGEFYEDGQAIAKRIAELTYACAPEDVAALAIEARELMNLRHAPLLLVRELCRHPRGEPPMLVAKTLARVVQRADELAEFLSLYWAEGKTPLKKQVKRGLAWAFHKFDEYQLAKYNRDAKVKLRDVLFLTHPKPRDEAEAALWKRLVEGKLAPPDTWEVELSAGKDKRETFIRLLSAGKLGYLAMLRNLRGMHEAGVPLELLRAHILARKGAQRVLPFRFIAAAKACPALEPELDRAMVTVMAESPQLPGMTALLVDNSGSMQAPLSARSDLERVDAAAGLAILVRGICMQCRVFAFSDSIAEVPPRQGMSLRDAIKRAVPSGGTRLGQAVMTLNSIVGHDRLIVITDEQSRDPVGAPRGRGYIINVASARNGVGYGPWVHIDGFSENTLRFITAHEADG